MNQAPAPAIDTTTINSIGNHLLILTDALTAAGREISALVETVQAAEYQAVADQWARTWGETVKKTDAARMLGVGSGTVYELISQGALPTAPNGRVLVREACRWAYSGAQQDSTVPANGNQAPPKRLPAAKRFRP